MPFPNNLTRRAFDAILLTSLLGGAARADSYPSRPIKLVIPFAPGLVTDATARLLAEHLRESLGQPLVVENKAGLQGVLGTQAVASAAPDGYTLLVATIGTHAANSSLFKKLPYDPVKDFAPVGLIGTAAWALVVRADDPARNVAELLTRLRNRPGGYHAGYFSAASQVCISLMDSLAGTTVAAVPYKGNTQALTDLIGGQLDFGFLDIGAALAQQKGGRVRLLAVTSLTRSPLAPEIAPLADTLPGYEIVSWSGVVAPAGTPRDVVQKLDAALQKALAAPDLRQRFAALAFDATPMSAAAFGQLIRTDAARWGKLVRDAGIEAQ